MTVCEEILEPANVYRNRRNDVTEILESSKNADTEPAKSRCSKQAEKRWSDKRTICAQIDKCEATNWRRMRPQENTEPAEAGGGKCCENEDAAAYGRTRGKKYAKSKPGGAGLRSSKSLAPANRNLAGKKLTQQSRGLGGTCCEQCGPGRGRFSGA